MDDLVFAKVRGYPAWPARITGATWGKYTVFFYGTYEVGSMKPEEIWPYNHKNLQRFGPPNMRKKGYSEGLYQIENTPEIAILPAVVVGEGLGGVEHVQEDGLQLQQHGAQSSGPVFVKILSTNELKEIDVTEDQNNNNLDGQFKAKIECNIELAEKILLTKNEGFYREEFIQELKEKVEMVKKEEEEVGTILKKVEKLRWLRCEQRLVDIVCEIKKCLGKNTTPNIAICLEQLKLLEELDIKPLMVIKIPEVFMTVKRLSTERIVHNDDIAAEEIKERSGRIKVKIMIDICKGVQMSAEEFEEIFARKVKEFNIKTLSLSVRERMCIFKFEDL